MVTFLVSVLSTFVSSTFKRKWDIIVDTHHIYHPFPQWQYPAALRQSWVTLQRIQAGRAASTRQTQSADSCVHQADGTNTASFFNNASNSNKYTEYITIAKDYNFLIAKIINVLIAEVLNVLIAEISNVLFANNSNVLFAEVSSIADVRVSVETITILIRKLSVINICMLCIILIGELSIFAEDPASLCPSPTSNTSTSPSPSESSLTA